MNRHIPLSRFPFFRTTHVDQSRDALARVYADGVLAPVDSRKSFSYQFNVAPLGRITLTAMNWGCGMTFDAPSLDGCFDFSSIVRGSSEIRVGHVHVEANPEHGVVMSPSQSLHIRWSEPLVSLNAKVERGTLESHLAAIAGVEVKELLEFSPGVPIAGAMESVRGLIRLMAREVDRDASLLASPLVAERFSETLLTSILYAQPHNYSSFLAETTLAAAPTYVRRAEEYLEAHCDETITSQSLALEVGVSVRTLYTGFRRHRSHTPIEFLRAVRLRRVRDALLTAGRDDSVSRLAMRWGFAHLGRFSALYRKAFGESPSDTLRHRS